MTLVAFVSGRSPGLTTAVHALASTWPAPRRAILAELDPDGGSLAARQELPADRGLTTLAAAGRRGLAPETVLRHCRPLAGGAIALTAPLAPDRVASALGVLGTDLADVLDWIPETDVLADCGRIDSRSPALPVVHAARYVVLAVAPTLEGVAHAQARADILSLPSGQLAVLTIGTSPYRPEQVGAALGLPVLGAISRDQRGADLLAAGRPNVRGDLLQSAAIVARHLTGFLSVPLPTANHPDRPDHPDSPNSHLAPGQAESWR